MIPRRKMNGMYILRNATTLTFRVKGCVWGCVDISCYLAAR